jgi:hypothetical protein
MSWVAVVAVLAGAAWAADGDKDRDGGRAREGDRVRERDRVREGDKERVREGDRDKDGARRSVRQGEIVRVAGNNVICETRGDRGATEFTIATNAATEVVAVEGTRMGDGEGGGDAKRELITKPITLADLKPGMRIQAKMLDDVAARIMVMPVREAKEGREPREGGDKDRGNRARERRGEGDKPNPRREGGDR